MDQILANPIYLLAKDVITFLLTGVGILVAGLGLVTWKKQIKGTKDFDTAYNLHYSLLKLRDAIEYVRGPAIFPSESNQAIKHTQAKYPEKPLIEIEKNSIAYVYEMRWEKITAAFTEMESHMLAAEVLWGPEILTLVKPMREKVTILSMNIRENFTEPDMRTMDRADVRGIIYARFDEKDLFANEVNGVIKAIGAYLKTKMS